MNALLLAPQHRTSFACPDGTLFSHQLTPAHRLYFHELLVAGYSAHNVFSNGTGVDVCLDHHGGAPHNNLWTDIDLVRSA
jgi:hypothetical protein